MIDLRFIAFQDYIKTLCEAHADVAHSDGSNDSFVRFQSEDDVLQLPQHGGGMIVIITNFMGRAIGEESDFMMRQNATLFFLKCIAAGSGDRARAIEQAQSDALDVMFDFYSRMYNDRQSDDCGPLRYLRPELMTWQPIAGPVLENHFGWEMTIPFDVSFPVFNPKKWNDQ